ncbi:hypothetical protein KZZ52_41605 [Dactylosporangium sp. AC04546]|uniref:hypothetical protein n=1 Tax=Dactylosporangium sp. AC04546 TaxID=2862460 RepID=UPI001EE07875|nr:hypothetical protein [Dactylosporangium sp. AC04546]WVK80423.1 hypothetical protein KZZ52_41605 [Dactylosporangium sp. AC04546]
MTETARNLVTDLDDAGCFASIDELGIEAAASAARRKAASNGHSSMIAVSMVGADDGFEP